ncbi:cytochrome c maturation protein CcmE [Sphingomicrobium arenosum]|uniref:cytochrome c maturation protein CcmE n=1 Tax=Sphingomicrobium arenosum TaxID=2233861 RepID=UPI00223F39A3|nr:cytochrome c maturation protein CcmE [Sphingomicrobium arenosum]
MNVAPKNQRLLLVILAIVALGGAALLALWGLQDRAAYFVTPTDIAEGGVEAGVPLRLGGMVVEGSIEQVAAADTVRTAFRLGDGAHEVAVAHTGILPDLFVEGSGAVAEGRLTPDGSFEATRILAKHDENYMPPELTESAKRATGKTVSGE